MNFAQQLAGHIIRSEASANQTGSTQNQNPNPNLRASIEHYLSTNPLAPYTFDRDFKKAHLYMSSYMKRNQYMPAPAVAARALAHTAQLPAQLLLQVSDAAEIDRDMLLETLREELIRCLSQGKLIENQLELQNTSVDEVRELMQEAQQEAYEMQQYRRTRGYLALVEMLSCGLPPPALVRLKCGAEQARTYSQACDEIEAAEGDQNQQNQHREPALDIDQALELGREMAPSEWTKEKVANRALLLSIYWSTLSLSAEEASEYYYNWRRAQTAARNDFQERKRRRAADSGVWRIRNNESEQWRQNLGDAEWQHFCALNEALHVKLGRGVYQHVPRRHFSENSLLEMRRDNIPAMERFLGQSSRNQ